MSEKDWNNKIKGMLKAELKRKDISYSKLADKLKAIGVEESVANISNKINRGKFSTVFFIQCLSAIGIRKVLLDD